MSYYLYIFLDETGDFNFSINGSPLYTITSVCKKRPFNISHGLGKYKYDLIEYGFDLECFHCVYDNQHIKNKVLSIIESNIQNIRIDSIIIDKRKTHPQLQKPDKFYPLMLGYLIRYILNGISLRNINEIIMITDTLPIKKRREALKKGIKIKLNEMLPKHIKYRIMHHTSKSIRGLQISDYCNWAIHRKWEKKEEYFYNKIKRGIKSEFDVFRGGRIYYY